MHLRGIINSPSHLSAYRAWQTRQNDRKKHRKGAETDREGDSGEEKRRVVTLLRGKMFHTHGLLTCTGCKFLAPFSAFQSLYFLTSAWVKNVCTFATSDDAYVETFSLSNRVWVGG